MAVSTYNAIASVTLSSAQAGVTFTNIPQIYTDLVIVVDYSLNVSNSSLFVRLNGDSADNYSHTRMSGTGSVASSGRGSTANQARITADTTAQSASTRQLVTVNLMNYNNPTYYKTLLSRYNSTGGTEAVINLYRSAASVTSVQIKGFDGTAIIEAGSTFTLYGIGINQLKATGGDIITTDGTYWYHAFKTSGTFTPNSTLSCDVLVVAGGGAGGGYCGGGGAGGVAYQTSRSVSSAATVTIGAGGARQATVNQSANGASGSNSVFDTITANGGGGGGSIGNNGTAGGSGGGGANATTGGAATQGSSGGATGYGFAGGTGLNAPTLGGGGGGAGAVGANSVVGTNAGNGGIGLDTWSAWMTATGLGISGYIAGGGGGGSDNGTLVGRGGFGGGSAGSSGGTVAPNAMVNTGGGGGGSQNPGGVINSGAGGSGLVIVRYAV
jgi:mucin-19